MLEQELFTFSGVVILLAAISSYFRNYVKYLRCDVFLLFILFWLISSSYNNIVMFDSTAPQKDQSIHPIYPGLKRSNQPIPMPNAIRGL